MKYFVILTMLFSVTAFAKHHKTTDQTAVTPGTVATQPASVNPAVVTPPAAAVTAPAAAVVSTTPAVRAATSVPGVTVTYYTNKAGKQYKRCRDSKRLVKCPN